MKARSGSCCRWAAFRSWTHRAWPFHDPAADAALFDALERTVRQTDQRQLIRVPHALNDPHFADALLDQFHNVMRNA